MNRNYFASLVAMIEYLQRLERVDVVIIDNESTYPQLLDWYKTYDGKIVFLGNNIGNRSPWLNKIVMQPEEHSKYYGSEYYIVTDPDLSLDKIPNNLLDIMIEASDICVFANKIGLSLEINDIPEDSIFGKKNIVEWESQFWKKIIYNRYWHADVDTTFALYKSNTNHEYAQRTDNSIRLDRPYTAKHLPWYFTTNNITDEFLWIVKNSNKQSCWASQLRNKL